MATPTKEALRDQSVDVLRAALSGVIRDDVVAVLNGPMLSILHTSSSPGEAAGRMVDEVNTQHGGTLSGHQQTRRMVDDLIALARRNRRAAQRAVNKPLRDPKRTTKREVSR